MPTFPYRWFRFNLMYLSALNFICQVTLHLLALWKGVDLVCLSGIYVRAQVRVWSARRQKSCVKITKRQRIPGWKRFQLSRMQGFRCASCWHVLPDTIHVDHIRNLQNHGLDDESNWQILCPTCHDAKTVITDPKIVYDY